jgi:hypothetical protein
MPVILIVAVVAAFLIAVFGGIATVAILVMHRLNQGSADGVPAALRITVVPTATGTDVSLRIDSSGDSRLPGTLKLGLTPKDEGIDDNGTNLFTDAPIGYSQVRDGAGKPLLVAGPGTTIKDVATDGQSVSVSFRVASITGKRVIFPIPYSPSVRFGSITVQGASATTSCLQSAGAENGRLHYHSCTIDPSGVVAWGSGRWAPDDIRLELAG